MNRTIPLVTLLLTSALVGCLGGDDADPIDTQASEQSDLPIIDLPTFERQRLKIDVTVPVVLIGFPDQSVTALQERLGTHRVDHEVSDFQQALPPDPEQDPAGHIPAVGTIWDVPALPTAVYDVQPAPEELEARLAQALPAWELGNQGDVVVYDANALEAFLADTLPAHGHELDPNAPSLVITHLDALEAPLHTWRYDFPHGWLEPVNSFGERTPMHILETSATLNRPTPVYHQVTGEPWDPHQDKLDPVEDVGEIEHLVREATEFRLLHSPIYPLPLTECHAITMILGVRPTGLGEATPTFESGAELFHADEIGRAFQNLTGDTVHVDAKVLELPVDDPALDALARGEFATLEAMRGWLAMNWEDYWVEHEGCEAYLSLVFAGDAATTPTAILGIGTYDHDRGYRISISWINDLVRLLRDPASPTGFVLGGDASSGYNWIDFLFTHEIGHTIGVHHPFHNGRKEGSIQNDHFQDTWTAMSYSTDGRVIDFSALDQANWQRNRMAYRFVAADQLGETTSEPWSQALEHAGAYHWGTADDLLGPMTDGQRPGGSGEGSEPLGYLPPELVLFESPSLGAHPIGPPH